MNRFTGIITRIDGQQNIHQLSIQLNDVSFRALIIDHEINPINFSVGDKVGVIFKDSEVFMGKDHIEHISIQNQVSGVIKNIEIGDVLSRVFLETSIGMVSSLISSSSVKRLDFKKGEKACAFIKTNEIILEKI
ncbi:TOBE domain-containing protein [Flammeovirga yaeyamensis]|uniref:TOBE domain-containing protein n=1 Tax=Flammeovirga yaeyamensis TaxID=367791 RepID=A0AAX1N3S7_9BACT|nr:TOBE domain-containing protein [Flammeovirga yaeyamensis]MBB3696002.1 molybdopterin-binding protein [Flammeovirga yaeyamensis]NMF34688.1 TOBE domain-containing protein [Flammeovirga yaeyamensis]QWG00483.1 TOBE domain-containing protein [Flammeovirga yaeyamensis]